MKVKTGHIEVDVIPAPIPANTVIMMDGKPTVFMQDVVFGKQKVKVPIGMFEDGPIIVISDLPPARGKIMVCDVKTT